MNTTHTLTLRDRVFTVNCASVMFYEGCWQIEIETEPQEIDGEWWSPRLYHQGLLLPAITETELESVLVSWKSHDDPKYHHPELGIMYVFGHHQVRECSISFGKLHNHSIELSWNGLCDVFWDDEYSEDVPFFCNCNAAVNT